MGAPNQLPLADVTAPSVPSVTHWYCSVCGTRYRTRHRRSPTRRRYRERVGVCRICTKGMQLLLAQHRADPKAFLRALGQGARGLVERPDAEGTRELA